MLACGLFRFGRLKGIERPAIISSFPRVRGHCVLIDMGANVGKDKVLCSVVTQTQLVLD